VNASFGSAVFGGVSDGVRRAAIVGGINTVISAMYYIKVMKVMILEPRADDLPAGKTKRPAEELCPSLRRARMMCREPLDERPVRLPQRLNPSRIFGGRLDFEAITNDPRIGEQSFDLRCAESGGIGSDQLRAAFYYRIFGGMRRNQTGIDV